MSVLRPLLSLSCLVAALLLATPASAQAQAVGKAGQDKERARGDERSQQQQRQDTLSDSIRRIERSTRGQVLSAERMQSDGRDVNRIKVVDDSGRVRIYLDDPRQGRRPPPTRGDDD